MLKNTMRRLSRLLTLVIAAVTATQAFGGMTSTVENLNIRDGLSNNYVTSIVQDKRGEIWVGTEAGLNRFNGHSFMNFTVGDIGLPGDAVTALQYDGKNDRLWVGTKSGLAVIQLPDLTPVQLKKPADMGDYNITDITPASDGGLWIVNHYGSVTHYDPETGRFNVFSTKNVPGLPNEMLTAADDGYGNLLIGHFTDGLSVVDMKTRKLRRYTADSGNPGSLPGNRVRIIRTDTFNNIWVGTSKGLSRFDVRNGKFTTFRHRSGNPASLAGDAVYAVTETPDGTLWIGTDIGGVSCVPVRDIAAATPADPPAFSNIIVSNDSHGVSSKNIRSILNDSYGNIWIGNFSSGLDFIPHRQPPFRKTQYFEFVGNGARTKSVWSLLSEPNGDIWGGGENEIALFRDGNMVRAIDLTPYLTRAYDRVENLTAIGDKLLIGLDNNGVLELGPDRHSIRRVPMPGVPDKPMNSFTNVGDSLVVIGAEDGLYIYRDGAITRPQNVNDEMKWLSVNSVAVDRQGKYWVGTYGGGILVFGHDGRLVSRLDNTAIPSSVVNHVVLDSRGYIWAATGNGVLMFPDTSDPKTFKSFSTEQGLTDRYCRAIAEDAAGDIWISTNGSISRWNRISSRIENFDHRAGLPRSSFMSRAVTVAPDGQIHFGSLNGIWSFVPQDVVTNERLAPIVIYGCESLADDEGGKHNSLIPLKDGRFEVPYDRNSIRVYFSVPDYSQVRMVEYEYMMVGMDREWHSTQGQNYVIFRNLPAGKYTFKVRARLYNGEETTEASVRINVIPPVWQRWYAILFYVMVLGAVVTYFMVLRDRRVKRDAAIAMELENTQAQQRLDNERLRFYTNISHELRTPLTLIIGPLEDLSSNPQMPAKFRKKLDMVHHSAQSLLNLVNELLEFRKTETANRRLCVTPGNLAALVTELGLKFKEFNRNPEVEVKIEVDKSVPMFLFDREIVRTIINNLMSNALKYTPDGQVTLGLRMVEQPAVQSDRSDRPDGSDPSGMARYAEIYVADTGLGISRQDLDHIFDRFYRGGDENTATGTGIGLSFSKTLAQLHKALISVESVEGEGSVFRLQLPVDETYPEAAHGKPREAEIIEEEDKEEDKMPTLLIVEDNADIREYVKESFKNRFKVEGACDGKEGLEKARAIMPDIIISDIMMPAMDGVEMCRRLKSDINTSHIPVVLLTAKDSIEDKEVGYQAGAESYITKPFSARLLSARIDNIIRAHRRMAQHFNSGVAAPVPAAMPEEKDEEIRPRLNKLDREFLDRFDKLIADNIQNPNLSITMIADHFHMSNSTVYRKILTLTGQTPVKLIRRSRLNMARQLLVDGHTVSEAAYSSGFNDLGYFRSCFKEDFGVSPSAYKKSL